MTSTLLEIYIYIIKKNRCIVLLIHLPTSLFFLYALTFFLQIKHVHSLPFIFFLLSSFQWPWLHLPFKTRAQHRGRIVLVRPLHLQLSQARIFYSDSNMDHLFTLKDSSRGYVEQPSQAPIHSFSFCAACNCALSVGPHQSNEVITNREKISVRCTTFLYIRQMKKLRSLQIPVGDCGYCGNIRLKTMNDDCDEYYSAEKME